MSTTSHQRAPSGPAEALWGRLMKPDELAAAMADIYSRPRGARAKLARAIGVDVSSLRRWLRGEVMLRGSAASAVRLLRELTRTTD